MMFVLGCVIPDAGGLLALNLVALGNSVGLYLSLGRCLGKLIGRLFLWFANCAGLLVERDLSE